MRRATSVASRPSRVSQRGLNSNKENDISGPPVKKRKFGGRDTPFKAVLEGRDNGHETMTIDKEQEKCPSAQVVGGGEWEESRMATEDVEALLNIKIAGKSRFDLKKKCEEMVDYIRQLKACIRKFLQVETAYMLQLEQCKNQLEEEKLSRNKTESAMKKKHDELELALIESRKKCCELEEELAAVKEERQVLLEEREKDTSALREAKSECLNLNVEVEKIKKDLIIANEQISSLQDINKRLTEYNTSLQAYNCKLHSDVSSAAGENAKTQQEKAALLECLSTVRSNATNLQAQLDATKLTLREESKQKNYLSNEFEKIQKDFLKVRGEKDICMSQIQTLKDENSRFREFTGRSASELEIITNKAIALEENYMSESEKVRTLHSELDIANQKLKLADTFMEARRREVDDQSKKTEELQARLSEAEQRLNEGEMLRRKLHNIIQELKGNVRVFCRVRPLLPDDSDFGSESNVVQYPQSAELLGRGIELAQAQGQKYTFTFDKVFGPDFTQERVFEEISQLVQSALDGYKVCIFAYGQTGSGKTYTMLGQADQAKHKGIIPRSLEQIFKSSQILGSQGWKFKMQASMLEIYNETVRDLLIAPKPASSDSSRMDSGTPAKSYIIKHDAMGNTHVSDLTLVEVTSWSEVSTLLRQAALSRTVGKTAMNEQSSRSHCVFTLRISGVNESTEQQVHGVLNLVDLAGSERLSRSGATGERLKETQAINKSLSSLGDVILAIANKEQHIPFRNSKLTYLLQPCLGGDSKTLMFVNVSPDGKSLNESLCSLRFAAKVNACEIGVPKRQTFARAAESRLSSSG